MSINILLVYGVGAVIVTLTVIIAYLIIQQIDFTTLRKRMRSSYNKMNEQYNERRLMREVKRRSLSISIKMSFADKVELFLIDKSNIRRYLPFMNFYVLALICAVIFLISLNFTYLFFKFLVTAVIISLIMASLPVIILDILGKWNSEATRRKLAYFVSILVRWVAVKDDIIYAFEKSMDSGLSEPLRSYVRDMVIQARNGMDPLVAMDILRIKVDNEQFSDFILNIKQNYKSRGNTVKLLNSMEEQFYKIEEEFNERKISTSRDKTILVIIMFAVIGVGYFALKSSPKVYSFYMGTKNGQLLLMLFALLYAAGFFLFTRISRFKY